MVYWQSLLTPLAAFTNPQQYHASRVRHGGSGWPHNIKAVADSVRLRDREY